MASFKSDFLCTLCLRRRCSKPSDGAYLRIREPAATQAMHPGQTSWTQCVVITLPKKGTCNLHHCKNYRTISLMCLLRKDMLKVLLNKL